MSWETIFSGLISRDWQYTEELQTSFLRIRRLSDPGYPFISRLLLAKANIDTSPKRIFYKTSLWANPEETIIEWDNDPFITTPVAIAFRRHRRYKINYRIAIDIWVPNSDEDFPIL